MGSEEIKTHDIFFKREKNSAGDIKWGWEIIANNGELVCASSQMYTNKSDCYYNAKSTALSISKHFNL